MEQKFFLYRNANVSRNILVAKPIVQENVNHSIILENWMTELPIHLTTIPVIYLSIPGSHNSFSYSISPDSDVSPDSPSIVQQLGKFMKPLTKPIIYRWSVGQEKNVTEQLMYGIRYFDIRLVKRKNDVLVAHGLYGGNIGIFLSEINKFLDDHPKEVVVLDFQHFYEFTCHENHQNMIKLIEKVFKNKICPHQHSVKDISLKKMWHMRHQILIIYRCQQVSHCPLFWPSDAWITPWPDKLRVDELLESLEKGIQRRQDDQGYVTQGVLTPTIKYIFLHLFGSLKHLALTNNERIVSWLETKNCGKNGINVVICDFVESYEFCEKVVKLNYKK